MNAFCRILCLPRLGSETRVNPDNLMNFVRVAGSLNHMIPAWRDMIFLSHTAGNLS